MEVAVLVAEDAEFKPAFSQKTSRPCDGRPSSPHNPRRRRTFIAALLTLSSFLIVGLVFLVRPTGSITSAYVTRSGPLN